MTELVINGYIQELSKYLEFHWNCYFFNAKNNMAKGFSIVAKECFFCAFYSYPFRKV